MSCFNLWIDEIQPNFHVRVIVTPCMMIRIKVFFAFFGFLFFSNGIWLTLGSYLCMKWVSVLINNLISWHETKRIRFNYLSLTVYVRIGSRSWLLLLVSLLPIWLLIDNKLCMMRSLIQIITFFFFLLLLFFTFCINTVHGYQIIKVVIVMRGWIRTYILSEGIEPHD